MFIESQGDAVLKEIIIAEFCEAVKSEATKVDDWHTAKEKEAEEKLEALDGAWNVTMNDEEQENWISEMDDLILNLENLLDFCAANNAAFKKILKVGNDRWWREHLLKLLIPIQMAAEIRQARFNRPQQDLLDHSDQLPFCEVTTG